MGVLRTLLIGAAALVALPGAAAAHVVADPGRAEAGAYQAVVFRVGHGCGDAATTALRIEIPLEMASARPRPKPGWTLEIERQDGKVTAVTWRGELPGDQFDEFAVLFKLPDQAATLYFPTVQSCGSDASQWTEIPAPGERASHPAPALVVTPKAAAAETHQH
ncbi:MAG: nuclear export factor GLE1 [Phenylobacterium sp.]|uniref:YcnI family copper-binding membrane protein n=1 Tax=Phenylobacterium sp. TaxID=1871053 RepID=UPI0025DB8B54|nr:YcnI family protein [Phenylobacterium sp.]MBA4012414.1 nuclear export factor GLE1 [Phenylobacterium sp.]